MTKFLCIIFSIIICCFALSIMGYWIADQNFMKVVSFNSVLMVFNTALCFAVSSASLLVPYSYRRFQKAGRLYAGSFVFLFSAIILSQSITDINLGIDQLFVHPKIIDPNPISGRMAPPTSLCFMLCGWMLISLSRTRGHIANIIFPVTALLVMTVGFVVPITTSIYIEMLYNWHQYGRMAMSTAIGFILLSGALWLMWYHEQMKNRFKQDQIALQLTEEKNFSTSLVIFIIIAIASLNFYDALNFRETKFIKSTISEEADKLQQLITFQTNNRMQSFHRMALRWDASDGTPYAQWQADAVNYILQMKCWETIAWLNSDYKTMWTPIGIKTQIDTDFLDRQHDILKLIAQEDKLNITHPLDLSPGNKGFIAIIPLHAKNRADGFLVGVFLAKAFFNDIFAQEISNRYVVSISEDDSEFYNNTSTSNSPGTAIDPISTKLFEDEWGTVKTLKLYNKNWTIKVTPTRNFVQNNHTLLPVLSLIAGLIIAALLALLTHYIMISRVKSTYLAESEERNNLVLQGLSVGLWDWNMIDGTIFWSPKFLSILGLEKSSAFSDVNSVFELMHPDERNAIQTVLKNHIDGQAPYDIEHRLRHRDGYYVWLHATGQAQWDKNGKAVRMVGSVINITEQKNASLALRASERLKQALLDSSDYMIIFGDVDGNIHMVNKAVEKALGYSSQEIIWKLSPSSWHDEAEVIQRAQELTTQLNRKIEPGIKVFTTIPAIEGSEEREWTFIRKDGTRFPGILSVTEVRGENNNVVGYLGMIKNITALKTSEKQRDLLMAKLTESNTELGRFAYVASHDMQEPLRMISNFSALIEKEYIDKLDDDGKEYIHLVTQSALRMQTMVNDLLEHARLGNDTARFVNVSADTELKHVLSNLASTIKDHDAIVTHDEGMPDFKGNPVQFMRLMQNLIGNGLKYQKPDSQPLITISVEDRKDVWCFSIRDNGIGMEQKYVEQIFEPFKRLHSWEEYKGTGIGLAVCKKIVENHGGKIWATSEPDKGSCFYFTVPK